MFPATVVAFPLISKYAVPIKRKIIHTHTHTHRGARSRPEPRITFLYFAHAIISVPSWQYVTFVTLEVPIHVLLKIEVSWDVTHSLCEFWIERSCGLSFRASFHVCVSTANCYWMLQTSGFSSSGVCWPTFHRRGPASRKCKSMWDLWCT